MTTMMMIAATTSPAPCVSHDGSNDSCVRLPFPQRMPNDPILVPPYSKSISKWEVVATVVDDFVVDIAEEAFVCAVGVHGAFAARLVVVVDDTVVVVVAMAVVDVDDHYDPVV